MPQNVKNQKNQKIYSLWLLHCRPVQICNGQAPLNTVSILKAIQPHPSIIAYCLICKPRLLGKSCDKN